MRSTIASMTAHCRALCMFAGLLFASASHAQIATDGSLGAQVQLSGPNYAISSTLGQQRGVNLFHSFSVFNVGSSETAHFDSAAGTANIIARVTGGFGSEINGALSANANLYLLNPQGILVGANASINVAGSLHLSTADYIRFGNNTKFYANLSNTSVLSTTAPSAFGFLDGAVAPIRVSGATLNVANGQTLSLIGGDVVLDTVDVTVPGGRVNLVAAAGPGEVVLNASGVDATTLLARGDVRLDATSINGHGTEGANIYIRGGRFVMGNGSTIAGSATQVLNARVIDVQADSVQLRNSRIDYGSSSTVSGAPLTTATIRASQLSASDAAVISIAGGGNLSIDAGTVSVDSGASIGTRTAAGGRGGNLAITADSINLNAGTLTATGADGDAGGISINADSINIVAGGSVVSTASGAGAGGSIAINARELVIDGTQSTLVTGISAGSLNVTSNAGAAGEIIVDVGTLQMRNGFISSSTNGPGRGGDIRVSADSAALQQGAAITTETGIAGALGVSQSYGAGGSIAIDAANLQMASGARISASTFANGAGGRIVIDAAQLQIDSAGAALTTGITANSGAAGTAATGRGGDLSLNVNELRIRNQGQIASNAYGTGQAGRIDLSGNSLSISAGGVISASSFGKTPGAGAANDIDIHTQQLDIDDFGQITNSTTGPGNAGRLSIAADQVRIANGGLLQASSLSQSLQAGAVGDIAIVTRALTLSGGSIHARSFGSARPGRIEIGANSLTMDDGAVVSATSVGATDAGAISIRVADTLRLMNSSRITTEALQGSGGNLQIIAGNRLILSDSGISTSVSGPAANGGNIFIDPIYVVLSNSQIIARAVGGAGGGIDLTTLILIRDVDSAIDASSAVGISGRVDITGLDVDLKVEVARLPLDFLSSHQLQASPCAGRGNASQFTVAGRDGAYRSPLDYLQSPLMLDAPAQQANTPNNTRVAADASLPGAALSASLPTFASLCFAGG